MYLYYIINFRLYKQGVIKMIRYGFIRGKDDIKFLVLYSLTFINFEMTFENIIDICTWCDDGFDYFEFNEAFLELIESKHLDKSKKDDEDVFLITEKGIKTAKEFESRLPISIKERANISALRVKKEIRRNACISTKITKRDEADYVVTMQMEDIFSMDFMVVSENQGRMIEKQFKNYAEKIYDDILNSLIKEY